MFDEPSGFVGNLQFPIFDSIDAKKYFLTKSAYPSPYDLVFTRYSSPYRILSTTFIGSKFLFQSFLFDPNVY